MKNREEILSKSNSGNDVYIASQQVVLVDKNSALKAMDEYAKQEAIDFADFLNMHKYEFETQSSEQLYQLYLNSKK
jgi:hypothetical protein